MRKRMAFTSVDEYIDSQPLAVRATLERVRSAIRKGVPAAEESIAYNMPVYKVGGAAVVYFAAWRKHYSLYAATPEVVKAFEAELEPYEVEKGTIRFPLAGTVPASLIAGITRFRAEQVARSRDVTRSRRSTTRTER